ncbi:unnamed protein product [Calypogeia fissa]
MLGQAGPGSVRPGPAERVGAERGGGGHRRKGDPRSGPIAFESDFHLTEEEAARARVEGKARKRSREKGGNGRERRKGRTERHYTERHYTAVLEGRQTEQRRDETRRGEGQEVTETETEMAVDFLSCFVDEVLIRRRNRVAAGGGVGAGAGEEVYEAI